MNIEETRYEIPVQPKPDELSIHFFLSQKVAEELVKRFLTKLSRTKKLRFLTTYGPFYNRGEISFVDIHPEIPRNTVAHDNWIEKCMKSEQKFLLLRKQLRTDAAKALTDDILTIVNVTASIPVIKEFVNSCCSKKVSVHLRLICERLLKDLLEFY